MKRLRWLVVGGALLLLGCRENSFSATTGSKTAKTKAQANAAAATIQNALVAAKFVGTFGKKPALMSFARQGRSVIGEIDYTLFGGVVSRDKIALSVDGDGNTLVLKPIGTTNAFVGAKTVTQPVDALRGELSPDQSTVSGTFASADGPTPWTMSTKTKIADIDPPADVATLEAALVAGKWAGTVGPRPAELTVNNKAGHPVARLTVDRAVSTFQIVLTPNGQFTMSAQPQRLVTQTGRGYFTDHSLKKLSGTIETSGQASDQVWSFRDVSPAKAAVQ